MNGPEIIIISKPVEPIEANKNNLLTMDDVKRFHIHNSKNKFKSVYSKMFNKKFNKKNK